jgi:hypothetical protein
MTAEGKYLIVLFESVSRAIQAEKILKQSGIAHKLIPIPKQFNSDCGVCIRFKPEDRAAVCNALEGVEGSEVLEMPEKTRNAQ